MLNTFSFTLLALANKLSKVNLNGLEVLIVVFKPLASIFQSKRDIYPNSSTFCDPSTNKNRGS